VKQLFIALAACSLALGCQVGADLEAGALSDDDTAVEEARADRTDRADLALRAVSGFTVPSAVGATETRRVFTSAASFRAYFGSLPAGVDFGREWVAFYSAGVQRTGGYGASVSRVRLSGSGLTLKVTTRLESPGAGCAVTQALTKPVALVAFAAPRPRPEVARFERNDARRDCETAPSCAAVRCRAGTVCVVRDGRATCDVAPGACLTDVDCALHDNYCGGCACDALGRNHRPVTCSDPVACFRQPCQGLVARCDTATNRCRAVAPTSAGVSCGRATCAAGQVCCNASCGICTPPGGACIQLACAE